MSDIEYLVNNESDSAVINVSSENANFPSSNILDIRLSNVFKFTGNTSEHITFTFTAATSIDCIAMATNLTASATVQILGNTTDSWGAPAVTIDITETGNKTIFESFTSNSYQYWRVTFADASNSDNIQIQRLVLGTKSTLPCPSEQPKLRLTTTGTNNISNSGQVYGIDGYVFRTYDLRWQNLTEAEKTKVESLLTNFEVGKPFFIDPLTAINEDPHYMILGKRNVVLTHRYLSGLNKYSVSIPFREAF